MMATIDSPAMKSLAAFMLFFLAFGTADSSHSSDYQYKYIPAYESPALKWTQEEITKELSCGGTTGGCCHIGSIAGLLSYWQTHEANGKRPYQYLIRTGTGTYGDGNNPQDAAYLAGQLNQHAPKDVCLSLSKCMAQEILPSYLDQIGHRDDWKIELLANPKSTDGETEIDSGRPFLWVMQFLPHRPKEDPEQTSLLEKLHLNRLSTRHAVIVVGYIKKDGKTYFALYPNTRKKLLFLDMALLANDAFIFFRPEDSSKNSEIGPEAVWKPADDLWKEIHEKCRIGRGEYDISCITEMMQKEGASAQAAAFTQRIQKELDRNREDAFYMSDFSELGKVDLATLISPCWNSPTNGTYLLANGSPKVIEVKSLASKLDISKANNYKALLGKFPKLEMWCDYIDYSQMINLTAGGQRFVFSCPLLNGCRACELGGSAEIAFDFDNTAKFNGVQLLRLVEAKHEKSEPEGKTSPSAIDLELLAAVEAGKTDTVKKLLESGTDPNIRDQRGTPLLIVAVKKQHRKIVELLLTHDVDANAKDTGGKTALMTAALVKRPDHRITKLLTKHGRVNERDNIGKTALMYASQNGYGAMVERLLKKRAEPNMKDDEGMTALMFAAGKASNDFDRTKILEMLIHKGADVNIKNNKGKTPLILLMCNPERSSISVSYWDDDYRKLLENDASLNEKDQEGKTALLHTIEIGRIELAQQLIRDGADINAADRNGWSPLMYAAWNVKRYPDCSRIAVALLDSGADYGLKNKEGQTALMLAQKLAKQSEAAAAIVKAIEKEMLVETIFATENPTYEQLSIALEKARRSMTDLQFGEYLKKFEGMQIKWRGFVANVSEKEGNYWVFVCAECKNNLRYRSEYDTVFKLAYELAAGLNIEQEISFGGKIAKIQYPPFRVLLNDVSLN